LQQRHQQFRSSWSGTTSSLSHHLHTSLSNPIAADTHDDSITVNTISLRNPFITILLAIDGITAVFASDTCNYYANTSAALSTEIPTTAHTSANWETPDLLVKSP
jgi:hypothetical protein